MPTDLYDYIGTIKYPLKLPTLKYFYRMIISSVHQLHQLGIMHRDIKSSNYLMSPTYEILLSDMGLATTLLKRTTPLTIDFGSK